MDKSVIERLQERANPNNEPTIGEMLTLEQAVAGVLTRALTRGSDVSVQSLDDGKIAVIVRTDDPALIRAFEATRGRNVPS
jgi:hypothetical protein